MATNYWSTAYSHANDAGFRTWGDDISTKWQALGLVQTADTGQIDWTTVTRPAAGVAAGYEIFYLNDSLHSTAPIYIKAAYGTSSLGATTPGIWMSIGNGSNGTGTLTNPSTNVAIHQTSAAFAITGVASHTYAACVTEGVFWFCGAFDSVSTSYSHFFMRICRTADANGDPTSFGGQFTSIQITNGDRIDQQAFVYSPSFAHRTYNSLYPAYIIPKDGDDGIVDGDGNTPVYLAWYAFPTAKALCGTAIAPVGSLASGSTATFNLFGSNPQTFMALNLNSGRHVSTIEGQSTDYGLMMIWE